MFKKLLALFLVLTIFRISPIKSFEIPTAANLRSLEARGPSRFQYSVNLLVSLNSTMSISTLNNSKAIYWALFRYTNESFFQQQQQQQQNQANNGIQIFNLLNPDIRNPTIRSQFACSPSETECKQITVQKFDLSYLGMYSYQSQVNGLDSLFVDYNISTNINNLEIECLNQSSTCLRNESTNTINVLAGQQIDFTCSILIAQNSIFEPAAELIITSDDCSGQTLIEQIPHSSVSDYVNLTSIGDINIVVYKLSRKCSKSFSKFDTNKSFNCELRAKNQSVPSQLQKVGVYESLSSKIDVQYEPELITQQPHLFNRTLIFGQQVSASFSCPFDGNPTPVYEWRVASVSYNSSMKEGEMLTKKRLLQPNDFVQADRDYSIPKDLEIGLYVFECRARSTGLVNKVSQSVQFNLNIIPTPVNAKKAILISDKQSSFSKTEQNNTGAIIGGIIGGLVGLLLIVLLTIFLLRRKLSKGNNDEIEKAKELDIDITDGNPHLSSRTNLSTSNLTQQQGKSQTNGIGQKVIAGLMVPSSTAQSYAAIAHAAAAAAQSNQRNHQHQGSEFGQTGSVNNLFSSNSSNNLLNNQSVSKSYNNPGFFESTSYNIQNPLESPPPYDAALQQPVKNQQLQQQKDFMGGSSSRLLPGSNTPQQAQKNLISQAPSTSMSYTATPQHNLSLMNSTPNGVGNSLQHLGYQSAQQLQYTTVQNLARNRNPLLNGLEMDAQQQQQQQQQTQYTTINSLNPIDV